MSRHLIGLYSPRPGSGKSTLAAALMGHGYTTVKFAGPLKMMLGALLASGGCSPRVIASALEGELKDTPMALLQGKTPRRAMQTLGTEWGRCRIGRDLWTDLFSRRVEMLWEEGMHVVCDDLRFPNELETIRKMGGQVVRIRRPLLEGEPGYGHASEGGLDDRLFDLNLVNDYGTAVAFAIEGSAAIARMQGVE